MEETIVRFSTSDLYFAAFLQASGCELVDHYAIGQQVQFEFEAESQDEVDELTDDWLARRGEVVALDYADAIRSLKTLCYQHRQQQKQKPSLVQVVHRR